VVYGVDVYYVPQLSLSEMLNSPRNSPHKRWCRVEIGQDGRPGRNAAI
jgi:hypothetical protein